MILLPNEEIQVIHAKALEQGLDRQRDVMLSMLDPRYVSGLREVANPAGQLMRDLTAMNKVAHIVGGVTPLREWLAQAAYLSAAHPDAQRFFSERADRAARAADAAAASDAAGPVLAAAPALTLPERVLFKSELLPIAFVAGAARTATAVARVVIPQIVGGRPQLKASSGEPLRSYGTAWLIGSCHVITNWHVIEARHPSSAPAALADIEAQCAGAQAEFGFDDQNAPPMEILSVEKLAHGDRALDYAVLTLAAVPREGVTPLPLREAMLTIDPAEPFPVNIVQHPGAAAKQVALRNNLVVAQEGANLAYFTDTDVGSSGSPVCDDQWRVVALHKAATQRFGNLTFQGKDTAWINVGTPIALIIQDLRANAPDLWKSLGAMPV